MPPSPSPSATPGPSASPSTANVGGVTLVAPGAGSATGSLFGFNSTLQAAPVNWQDLPPDVVGAIKATNVPIHNAEDLMKALSQIDEPGVVAELQQMLWYSGKLDAGKPLGDALSGYMDQDTIKALGDMVHTAAQASSGLGTYMQAAANFGKAKQTVDQANTLAAMQLPADATEANLDATLKAQAESLLGHDVDQTEYAKFRAWYDQIVTDTSKKLLAAQQAQQSGTGMYGPGMSQSLAQAYQVEQHPVTSSGAQGNTGFGLSANAAERDMGISNATNQAAAQLDQTMQQAATSPPSTLLQSAPTPSAAAEQFLQQNNGPDIQTQNALSAYGDLLNFIKGDGSIK